MCILIMPRPDENGISVGGGIHGLLDDGEVARAVLLDAQSIGPGDAGQAHRMKGQKDKNLCVCAWSSPSIGFSLSYFNNIIRRTCNEPGILSRAKYTPLATRSPCWSWPFHWNSWRPESRGPEWMPAIRAPSQIEHRQFDLGRVLQGESQGRDRVEGVGIRLKQLVPEQRSEYPPAHPPGLSIPTFPRDEAPNWDRATMPGSR